jgi:hypothetical protein
MTFMEKKVATPSRSRALLFVAPSGASSTIADARRQPTQQYLGIDRTSTVDSGTWIGRLQ